MYYLADEPEVDFVWQPNQESSVLVMSRAFDDYYIVDCGVISAPEVTQRRTDSNDQFVILPTVGDNFLCWSAFDSLRKHTQLPFYLSKRVWWCVPDD
ncbi:hypothetical protein ZEAMMB73_Zm00001d024849 [Zea mays]|jgi:hypothetical protein|uniref:protein-serine/threonine phosphatase n=1 Tax=Zea mays TaxID=4577 RepID=A0A1D6J2A9_MAIZE|nr:hypothetical protein ZEAMMB73_Zm00001d024849 [Zea mays]